MTQQKLITIIGGSGFIGRHVVRALAKKGYRIRVACRRPDLAGFLQPLGAVGQIQLVQCNVRNPESIEKVLKGSDGVVNLVGILYKSGKQTFQNVQLEGAKNIAQAAKTLGIKTLVHLSAIGADPQSKIAYQATKGEAEQAILKLIPSSIIMRPSIVFGPEDNFFNLFANIARMSPILPLIGGGETKFAPVYVGDVAQAIVKGLEGELKVGATYELGGSEIKSFKQLLELVCTITQRKRLLAYVPWLIAEFKGALLEMLPSPLLTKDQVLMLKQDNVVSTQAIEKGLTLEGMGITPTTIEAILPTYLWRYRATGQFKQQKVA